MNMKKWLLNVLVIICEKPLSVQKPYLNTTKYKDRQTKRIKQMASKSSCFGTGNNFQKVFISAETLTEYDEIQRSANKKLKQMASKSLCFGNNFRTAFIRAETLTEYDEILGSANIKDKTEEELFSLVETAKNEAKNGVKICT
jgi:hypothetical protein